LLISLPPFETNIRQLMPTVQQKEIVIGLCQLNKVWQGAALRQEKTKKFLLLSLVRMIYRVAV